MIHGHLSKRLVLNWIVVIGMLPSEVRSLCLVAARPGELDRFETGQGRRR
jgi:hypothetical protein